MCTNMNNSALGFLLLSFVCIIFVITDVARADDADKAATEPEAASGCPLPDLRYSRPRKFDTGGSTELPTGAPPDALSTDVPDAPGEDDESRLTADRGDADVARHSRYIDYDPYAREEAKTFAYTGNDIAPSHIDLDHQHTIHRRRRRRHTVWSGSAKPTEKASASTTTTTTTTSSIDVAISPAAISSNPSSFVSSIDITTTNHMQFGRRTDPQLLLNAIETTSDHRSLARAPPNDTTASAGRRVKRKSGKTTGALSRPKGASDSSSKSTSRKKDGASLDEEGMYIVHAIDDTEDEEEEEEIEDAVEHDLFSEVNEVHFPAEIGHGGERKLCRLRCVQGRWVGPICASNKEGDDEASTAE